MSRPMRPRVDSMLSLVITVSACGPHAQVKSFSVEPQALCKGQDVVVKWDVRGRAALQADPTPPNWNDGATASMGSRRVVPAVTTKFEVHALDANPADGNSFARQVARIEGAPEEHGVTTTCDVTQRTCTGTFTLDASADVQVRRLSQPKAVQGGHVSPVQVCVSHPGLARTCLASDEVADVSIAGAGVWTLEATLGPELKAEPPPQLRILLGFGCP